MTGPTPDTAETSGSGRRGPGRPPLRRDEPLTVEEIVTTARHLVASRGLDGLSIRAVAAELKVAPTALYHHVGSKAGLLDRILAHVWDEVLASVPLDPAEPVEWVIRANVAIRRAWLRERDLARLASAVADVDDRFYEANALMTAVIGAAGFPDVALAYHALQMFTMGSVLVATSQGWASAVFGRDPEANLEAARRQLDQRRAPAEVRAVTEARFDVADEQRFEQSLRALVAGLLASGPG